MANNFIPTLPVFRPEGNEFAPSDKVGLWQNAKGTLGQLSRSLKVPKEAWSDPDEPIRAIPDPWAQARTFGEALIEKHSMHDKVLGQWRGLLAMFALRHLHQSHYSLTPKAVKLDGDHIFARVMRELPPAVALGDLVDEWKKPHLVMLTIKGRDPQPLAVTNPICLVSPGRSSLRITIPGVAWAQGEIRDPLSADIALPITEIVVLEAWVRKLAESVETYGGKVAFSIAQLLRDFANQCKGKLGESNLPVQHLDSDQQKLQPLFHHLWNSSRLETSGDPASSSRTRLRLRPDAAFGHLKGVILVDEAIGALPGFGAEHTFVWGTRTLKELLHEGTFNDTRKEAAQLGYWLVRAEDLFADRAIRLGKEAMVASHPVGLQDIILPLRPLALLLDQNLSKRIGGQSQPSRISVALELELGVGAQEPTRFLLTRHYSVDADSGDALLVDEADWEVYNASLWPNFRADSWSTYLARFTYREALRGHSLRPHLATSSRLICAEISDAGNANEAVIRLAELNRGAVPRNDPARFTRSEKLGPIYEDIQYSSQPFDAVLYSEAAEQRQDGPVGFILTQLEEVHTEVQTSVAAVDFGTTNTVACFASDQPVVFKPRLVFPITYTSPETNRASKNNARYVLSRFWPAEERKTPTPTVAVTRKGGSNADHHSAFRNIIYFHSHEPYVVNGEQHETQQLTQIAVECKFNLKWSEEATHTDAARDFLEQFMLMVAAEATVQRYDSRLMRWRFSIPDALTGRPRETFLKHVGSITRRISTGVNRDDPNPVLAPLYSEGLAAASFILLKAGFSNEQFNVVLDIGGGTTDVTIWDREVVLWNGSFRLAGQHFFTRALTQNSNILREIGLGQWASLLDGTTVTDVPRFEENKPQIAEILFSDERLQQAIDANWDRRLDLDVGKGLRLTALIALGGIAWYAGKVARHLVADGTVRKESLEAQAFALCGRGAGIFKKIHGGAAEDESDVTRVLRLFSVAAGIENVPLPQMFSSPDAKLEVVRGMIGGEYERLIDASAKKGFETAKSYLPVGLGIAFESGEPLAADALVSNAMLAAKVREVEMAEFDVFVEALRVHGGIRLDPLPNSQQGARKQVQGAVRQQLELERLEQEAGRALEPPFISGLRKLVEILASPADQSKDKLKVDFV
ncbi:MAG TPA: hypothetical protein VE053_08320 [Allosphingosinicella sp.]|nr:hypothetical protein [Allosphingosinicella sp.]